MSYIFNRDIIMGLRKLKKEEVPIEWLKGKTDTEIKDLLSDIPGVQVIDSFEMTEEEERKAHEELRRMVMKFEGIDIGEWKKAKGD